MRVFTRAHKALRPLEEVCARTLHMQASVAHAMRQLTKVGRRLSELPRRSLGRTNYSYLLKTLQDLPDLRVHHTSSDGAGGNLEVEPA